VAEEKQIPQPDAERIIHSLDTLKVYFDPVRTRIMQEMAHTPRTVQQIAEALGVPFTRLYYHVKMMEKHDLIRMVDIKQMPGAIEEKYYQVSARMFVIDRELLTFDPQGTNDSLELVLKKVFDESHTDVRQSMRAGRTDMSVVPPHPKSLFARRSVLRLTEENAVNFQQELMELMVKYQSTETSADDAYYAAVLALYPSNAPFEESEDDIEDSE
jgi:predicted transcriptional regulator